MIFETNQDKMSLELILHTPESQTMHLSFCYDGSDYFAIVASHEVRNVPLQNYVFLS